MARQAIAPVEIDSQAALREITASLPLLRDLVGTTDTSIAVSIRRCWHPPAGTYTYHTTTPVPGADQALLERAATLFLHANTLASQPWYPAFLGGSSSPLAAPLPTAIAQAFTGTAHFDFGLRRPRCYHQLIALLKPSATLRIVALRSISGQTTPSGEVKAYTLTPTADVFELRDNTLYWHHIVTVYGAALLPPAGDRLLMNLLRRLRLDGKERQTYREEAAGFQALCAATALHMDIPGAAPYR